jgi:hypothetical protein
MTRELEEACSQLHKFLLDAARQYHHIQSLLNVLEEDVHRIEPLLSRTGTSFGSLQIEHLKGSIQQEISACKEHQVRLEKLLSDILHFPNSPRVEIQIDRLSRLFESLQDTMWIERQPESERYTERMVHGILPSASFKFLKTEGQFMLAKFIEKPTSWIDMVDRLGGHCYWVKALIATLPAGNPLNFPLMSVMLFLETCLPSVIEQRDLSISIREFEKMITRPEDGFYTGRVLSLELARMRDMQRTFPTDQSEAGE